ncbi:hypothetical protein FQN49_007746 [Arthroderma sp. PD_2]|nr:hypothetical protein FQN49_007746 [Arthroderma sp. PD_2]
MVQGSRPEEQVSSEPSPTQTSEPAVQSQMAPEPSPSTAEMPHQGSPPSEMAPSPSPSQNAVQGVPSQQGHHPTPGQGNLCRTGDSFCCDEKHGKNSCIKSHTSCDQKVICCNNDNGYQFCVGDINFNMPITFDIDIDIDF